VNILLIDGYNVIARGLAKDPGQAMASDEARRGYREQLVMLAKKYVAGKKGLEVRIYFDGTGGCSAAELSDRSVKVVFAKGDQGADNAIIKFCRAYEKPKDLEVVSDDWATLGFHIRSHVGKLLSVAEWMRRLDSNRSSAGSRASGAGKSKDDTPLSQGAREAINRTLPASWFR